MSVDLIKSHINAYTKKNGTVVQSHDDKRTKKASLGPVAKKHEGKFYSKDLEWSNRGANIPASDIPAGAPEFSHSEVYGHDGKTSPAGDNFTKEFSAKAPQHFVLKHKNGKRHLIDTEGYEYARRHAPIDDSKPAAGGEKKDISKYIDGNPPKKVGPGEGALYQSDEEYEAKKAASGAAQASSKAKPADPVPPINAHTKDLRAAAERRLKEIPGATGEQDYGAFHSLADSLDKGDHKAAAATLRSMDTEPRDEAFEHIHPKHWAGLGFEPIDEKRSLKNYEKKHAPAPAPAAAAAKEAPPLKQGDSVKVTGNVAGAGKTGVIHETAPSGHFHVVKHSDGSMAAYHESNLAGHDPDDEEDEDDLEKSIGAGSGDAPLDLLKAHINAYTRKDGVVVQAHDDVRVASTESPAQAATRKRRTASLKAHHHADAATLKRALASSLSRGDIESDDGGKLTYGDVKTHLHTLRSQLGPEHKEHLEHAQYALNQSFGADHKPISSEHAKLVGAALSGKTRIDDNGAVQHTKQ